MAFGMQEGEGEVQFVELGAALRITELPAQVARRQVLENGQAFAERAAVLQEQGGRLASRVQAHVGALAGIQRHLDPTQAIGAAEPLEGHDRAEGTAVGYAIKQYRFHFPSPFR